MLTLVDHLRVDGVEAWLDRYEPSPSAGFHRWMIQQIRDADFVLLVCTETYCRRLMGEEEPGKGLGAMWEGSVILSELYNSQPVNEKFIPILPPGGDVTHIPEIVQGVARYHPFNDEGYRDLYRRLTNQPAVSPPPLGHLRPLRSQPRAPSTEPIAEADDSPNDASEQVEGDQFDSGRRALLDEMARASRGRCLERWQANGLTRAQAEELFEDASLGARGTDLHATAPRVALVIGELGAGKSLQGERYLQAAIGHALAHPEAPIPVYIAARAAVGQLRQVAQAATSGFGSPSVLGMVMVVDGLDEAGVGEAERLLREARVLADSWPHTAIVLTSRPLPIFDHANERVDVPPLSDTEALGLMGRVAGRELPEGFLLALPPSVRPAALRPLFAVLVGVYLRERGVTYPRSSADLLDTLVERAIGRTTLDRTSADTLLHRLAVASTERGGVPVPAAEVGTREEVTKLLDTRLVVEHDRALDFPLPLLTQWFAAQALIAGAVSPDELAQDASRLEYWRYPLSVLVATMGHDMVTRVLAPVAARAPALTSSIVHDALPEQHGRREGVALPLPGECGQRLHAAMSAWARGVGPLAPYIAPMRADGTVTTVATAVGTDGDLMVSWYRGHEALPDVVPLSRHYIQDTAWRDGWPELRIAQPVVQSAWAWRWTFDNLVGELKEVVERHRLPPPVGPLRDEAIWRLALTLAGKGPFHHDPIPLAGLDAAVARYSTDVRQVNFNGRNIDPHEVRAIVAQMRAAGLEVVQPPWPSPDLREVEEQPHSIWSPYSDAQLLARTRAVYAAALTGYEQLVTIWFPTFSPRLSTMKMLPAHVVGELVRAKDTPGFPPTLWKRWERLPRGATSEVTIELSDGTNEDMVSRGYPPLGWSAVLLFEDTPATDLVYGWLANDLRGVQWL
ncbi:MAG: toll/interleukin-1 receptor domain-containing protein [Chloroflexota bacterium]|nr:toll/interleukin-1 receptor domain-containing protein [Chloroflexota bacterium]